MYRVPGQGQCSPRHCCPRPEPASPSVPDFEPQVGCPSWGGPFLTSHSDDFLHFLSSQTPVPSPVLICSRRPCSRLVRTVKKSGNGPHPDTRSQVPAVCMPAVNLLGKTDELSPISFSAFSRPLPGSASPPCIYSLLSISSKRVQIFSSIFHLKKTKRKASLGFIPFSPGPTPLLF